MLENTHLSMGQNVPLFQRATLIGVGLIGSSVARGLAEFGLAQEIVLADRSKKHIETAQKLALGHEFHTDLTDAVKGADLVMLCTPVGAMADVMRQIAPFLKAGAIVSDVGSVKAHIYTVLAPLLPENVHLVPGHPIAGTEKSGPEHGFSGLFEGRWAILTPRADADRGAVEHMRALWQGLGAHVEEMDAHHHDLVLAITSHVPHLIAYNIVGTADDLEHVTKSEVIKFSAGGFRDFTRIAASDPIMWRDVFLTNRDAVLEMLGRFSEDLSVLQRAVRAGDGEALEMLFTRTRAIRRSIIDAGQETDEADFGRHVLMDVDGAQKDI